MTTQTRRALFALALAFSLPLPTAPIWAAPAQTAPETIMGGVVRNEQGAPIVGADIFLVRREGQNDDARALKTNAQGRFSFDPAQWKAESEAPVMVEIFVRALGYGLQRALFTSLDKNEITLKAGVAATGKVMDANGKPVANARVRIKWLVLSEADEPSMAARFLNFETLGDSALKEALSARTDANGVWKTIELPIGSQSIFQLDDPRFARADVTGTPSETTQKVPDLTATPGASLKGRVVDAAGKPVKNARIQVKVSQQGSGRTETKTAADGTYTLESLPAGNATIQVSSPDPALAPTGIKGIAVATGQNATAPEIKLGAGVLLTGRVTDRESKKPVAGAQLMMQGDFGDVPTTVTGKDGTYRARVPLGKIRFYLYSYPTGYVREDSAEATLNITANSAKAPDFSVRRGVTLTGTALDEKGAPAVDALIIAGDIWDYTQGSVDKTGNWTIEGVDAEKNDRNRNIKVRLKTEGDWQIFGDGTVTARENDKIALKLRRIERQDVTLRIVTPEGEPIGGVKVRLEILADAKTGTTRYENTVSNARGEVTVKRLRPDESVEVKPEKEGYALEKAGVITTFKANKTRATDAVMTAKNGVLRGRVVDADGVAAIGAKVAILAPGDLRDAKTLVQSDADGKFELDDLRAGELLVGAARGRDYGQVKATTGGDVEIKLVAAAPQPAPLNRVLAREMFERWFANSNKQQGATLTDYAAYVAGSGGPDTTAVAARSENSKLWFELEQTPELAQAQQDKAQARQERDLQAARDAVNEPKSLEDHQQSLLDLTILLAKNGEIESAREIYESFLPNVEISRNLDSNQAILNSYKYAQLAVAAEAVGHPGADYWLELLDRSIEAVSAKNRLFCIKNCVRILSRVNIDGALRWLDLRSPAEQVLSYEEIIPLVAKNDLPRAQELLKKMDELVARGDIPVEPDRNDGWYHPSPAHSLNVARGAIIRELLPTDPRAALAQSKKIINEDSYLSPDWELDAALRLPAAEALPILRAQFVGAQERGNRSVGAMAKLAKLVAPLDVDLSEQWFALARQKLAENDGFDDNTREMAAPYAFYRADSDAAESRLLLENEWQRALGTKPEDAANGAARLQWIVWAMAPIDWERALQMMNEKDRLLGEQYVDGLMTQRNLAAWLLASEAERRAMDFYGASAELLN